MEKLKQLKTKVVWLWNSYVWNPIHLRAMKRKANKLHQMTGKRYFVLPATQTKLMVVDNTYIKNYNKAIKKEKGYKKININDLLNMAYYATSTRSLVKT